MMNSFIKLLKIIILSESCPKNCVGKIVTPPPLLAGGVPATPQKPSAVTSND